MRWLLAAAGAAVVLTGALAPEAAAALLARTWEVLVFLVAVTALAGLAGSAGVFDVAAGWAARRGGGRTWRLWLLVVLLATAATAVLSLDTTAVLLTPVVLAVARRTGAPAELLALTCVWLANTASLWLPVSNLTNLLAAEELPGGVLAAAELTWAPALAATVATAALLALLFPRDLRSRYDLPPPVVVDDRVLLRAATATVLVVLPALAAGLPPWAVATAGAAVLAALTAWRRPQELRWSLVPLPLAAGVAGLFLVVAALGEHGLTALLTDLAGPSADPGAGGALRLAATAALAANGVNNLPAYLALEPALEGAPPASVVAVLIGVDVGPVVTPWASLATLLWAARCREAGVPVRWGRFVARGALLAPVAVLASVLALVATS